MSSKLWRIRLCAGLVDATTFVFDNSDACPWLHPKYRRVKGKRQLAGMSGRSLSSVCRTLSLIYWPCRMPGKCLRRIDAEGAHPLYSHRVCCLPYLVQATGTCRFRLH